MKISALISELLKVQKKFGDIAVTGGNMHYDRPLKEVSVTEREGMEIWPRNPNGLDLKKVEIDGVFLT